MSSGEGARSGSSQGISCGFTEFSELFEFPAHLIAHLTLCDAMTTLGVDATLYALPPSEGQAPSAAELASSFGLSHNPHVEWVRQDANKWLARLRVLLESGRIGRHTTFTYSTRGLPTLGALLGGSHQVVIEIHQPSVFWSKHDRWAFWLARHSRRLRIVCISRRLAEIVAREWHLDESTMIVEHMAHNFPIRDGYRASTEDWCRPRALYAGSFEAGKGLETLFGVARLHPEVDFVAVGGEVLDQDLPDNVSVRPRVAHADVPDLLAEADILLMPFSAYSGVRLPVDSNHVAEEFYSPNKMVEYLSAGRAIVSSDLPSIAEVLVDGSNCLLVEPDSLPAWSEAVGRLASDSKLRERLAQGAVQTARRHTSLERARRILEGLGVQT